MLAIVRNFLLLFLVLVQTCAPLVHAHTNETQASLGLHLPGLESYHHQQSQPALSATKQHYASDSGVLVSIDTGKTTPQKTGKPPLLVSDALPSLAWADLVNYQCPAFSSVARAAAYLSLLGEKHCPRAPPCVALTHAL